MAQKYTQAQVDEALRALLEVGYSGLDPEQQAICDWFDSGSQS